MYLAILSQFYDFYFVFCENKYYFQFSYILCRKRSEPAELKQYTEHDYFSNKYAPQMILIVNTYYNQLLHTRMQAPT